MTPTKWQTIMGVRFGSRAREDRRTGVQDVDPQGCNRLGLVFTPEGDPEQRPVRDP